MPVVPVSERYSMTDVARLVGVSVETVWRWTLRGVRGKKLQSYMLGGRRYVTHAGLEQFLEGAETTGAKSDAEQQRRATNAAKVLDGMGVGRRHRRDCESSKMDERLSREARGLCKSIPLPTGDPAKQAPNGDVE